MCKINKFDNTRCKGVYSFQTKMVRSIVLTLFLLTQSSLVTGEVNAEMMCEYLALRIDGILTETKMLKLRMDSLDGRIRDVEDNLEAITSQNHVSVDDIEVDLETDLKRTNGVQSEVVRKMLTDEKTVLRKIIERFDQKITNFKAGMTSEWAEFKKDVKNELESMNRSLDKDTEDIFIIVQNNSNEIERDITQLSQHMNSTLNDIKFYIEDKENSLNDNIQTVRQKLSAAVEKDKASLHSKLDELSSRISSTASKLSSESSSLSSRISSLSSSLSSESSSLSSRISSLSGDLSSLSSRMSRKEERKVAFSARLTTADSYYTQNERIDFNDVLYSYGGGYDSSTGIFTAPKSGTYLFWFNVESTSTGDVHVKITVDGIYKGEAQSIGVNNAGGNSVAVYVYAGDQVWIATSHLKSRYYIAPWRTMFMGVLID